MGMSLCLTVHGEHPSILATWPMSMASPKAWPRCRDGANFRPCWAGNGHPCRLPSRPGLTGPGRETTCTDASSPRRLEMAFIGFPLLGLLVLSPREMAREPVPDLRVPQVPAKALVSRFRETRFPSQISANVRGGLAPWFLCETACESTLLGTLAAACTPTKAQSTKVLCRTRTAPLAAGSESEPRQAQGRTAA